MSKTHSITETSTLDTQQFLQVNSNKTADVLAQTSTTTLADLRHVRITSTPGDDLAEEDFADRVRSLLEPMSNLASMTLDIPSMARLHPSNSLPKVVNVLHDVSTLLPQCRLGLVVHEGEQAWGALAVLNRIVKMQLPLNSIEFTRAFFPVETLIHTARACGLASLTLDATQVFQSSNLSDVSTVGAGESRNGVLSIPTLTSLTIRVHSEASPGLDLLLQAAASTLTYLDLSSGSGGSDMKMRERDFPSLTRLCVREDLLLEAMNANMPELEEIILPTLTQDWICGAIQEMLQSSWSRMRVLRISRVIAGDVSEALVRLAAKYPSVIVTIENIAVREPEQLTPATLSISEHLVNAGPPILEDWPPGFNKRQYPRLKSIVLKVAEGCNHNEFVASIDAPNLEGPPRISLIAKKKGKIGKK